MLVFQSKAQLKANYPKDYQIIQDNCEVMILIKTKDTELASSLSRAFGTYENKAKSTNKDKDGKISGSSYHVTKEPILTETEILQLPRGKILVWIAGHKPIITSYATRYKNNNNHNLSIKHYFSIVIFLNWKYFYYH